MDIALYRGYNHQLEHSDINIVIDVIRAFTVAQYAFMSGAKEILLVGTIDEAFKLKEEVPEYLLAGEVQGLPIEGFDLDNSPRRILSNDVKDKTLVQKTTNGVRATLNSLNTNHLFVTGLANAKTTVHYIKEALLSSIPTCTKVNIIASHPTGEDDWACAEYIKSLLEGESAVCEKDIAQRVIHSPTARKFFDKNRPEFDPADITYCVKPVNTGFVMKVNKERGIPTIERVEL